MCFNVIAFALGNGKGRESKQGNVGGGRGTSGSNGSNQRKFGKLGAFLCCSFVRAPLMGF